MTVAMLGKFYQYKDNKGTNWPLYGNMQVMLSLGEGALHFVAVLLLLTRKNYGQPLKTGRRLIADWSENGRRPNYVYKNNEYLSPTKLFWQPIAEWSAIIDNHLPTTENLRKPPKKKWLSEVGERLSNSLTTNRRLVGGRLSTNICRPLTTSSNHPKKVVVRGRRLVVTIVWPWLTWKGNLGSEWTPEFYSWTWLIIFHTIAHYSDRPTLISNLMLMYNEFMSIHTQPLLVSFLNSNNFNYLCVITLFLLILQLISLHCKQKFIVHACSKYSPTVLISPAVKILAYFDRIYLLVQFNLFDYCSVELIILAKVRIYCPSSHLWSLKPSTL